MQLVRSIIQLLVQGYSERAIHRELGISRTTVRRYIKRFEQEKLPVKDLLALKDGELSLIVYPPAVSVTNDPRRVVFQELSGYFLSELKRTGVTRLLLWEEYKKEYPEGYEYSKFCELLKEAGKPQEATMHFDHDPAALLMVDFAGDKLHYVCPDSGELIECPVLVCVLPYSGYSYAVALANATIPQVIKGLNACLAYFGGVPNGLKSDNMRQLVAKSCRYEPIFTEVFRQWALHNNIILLAARPRKPKDKPHVENEVKLTYQRIYAPLRNEEFHSIQALNAAIERKRIEHHQKSFSRKEGTRLQCFQLEEQSLLQPLPAEPYQVRHSVRAKVQKNYHVTLGEDWHHYSVPHQYIGKTLQAVYDTETVEIYLQHQRIALHKRSYRKHGYTTLEEHMPEGHRQYHQQRGWDSAYFLRKAESVGPCTREYVAHVLAGKRFTQQTYNACLGILRLGRNYGEGRLESACKRALTGGRYTYRILENILKNHLDRQSMEQGKLFRIPAHDNLRGPHAYD